MIAFTFLEARGAVIMTLRQAFPILSILLYIVSHSGRSIRKQVVLHKVLHKVRRLVKPERVTTIGCEVLGVFRTKTRKM